MLQVKASVSSVQLCLVECRLTTDVFEIRNPTGFHLEFHGIHANLEQGN